jgi:hypothetical protein
MPVPEVLLSLGLLMSAAQPSGTAHLEDLQVGLQGQKLEASVRLVNAFDAEFLELIQTGLSTGFTFNFKLFADRKRWFDNEIASTDMEVAATYDAVTREYTVNYLQDGKLLETRVVRDEQELERVMTRIESVHVFSFDGSPRRRRLLVRARAELGSKTFLYLIPTTRTTGWLRSRKFNDPGTGL